MNGRFAICIPRHLYSEELILSCIRQITSLMQDSEYKMKLHAGVYPIGREETDVSVMCDRANMAISTVKNNYDSTIAYYDTKDMERGMIPPYAFIELFERAGLIHKLDLYIWEQAAKKLSEWKKSGQEDLHISVNISVKDFYYLDIYKTFTELVEKYEIPPPRLKLEITETALMLEQDKMLVLLEKLQRYGFSVEIDDFGSGYSSLNMAVITEGVETETQLAYLLTIGCDMFQGYYFDKPISVKEFEEKYL